MSRRALAVTLGVFVLLFGVLTPGRSAPVHGASLAKKTCKFVKKHGKHTKVCHTVTPEKLVGTPTPVPLPFNLAPVTRQCSATTDQTGCADLGFALSENTGTTTLSNKDAGYTMQINKFGIMKSFDGSNYMLFAYMKTVKNPSKDGSLTPWQPTAQSFQVIAANGHPYTGLSCRIPSFNGTPIYNGESDQGWICSSTIDSRYINSTFTWSFTGYGHFNPPSSYGRFNIPMVDVTVRPK